MIKNVFFDFNGTLLDDLNLCFKIEEEIIDMYGLKPVTMDFYLDNFCFPVKKYYEKAGFDFSKHDYAEISKIFFQKYNKSFLNLNNQLQNQFQYAFIEFLKTTKTKVKIFINHTF